MIFDFKSPSKNIKKEIVGGKFYNLFFLYNKQSLNIPEAFCITSADYNIEDLKTRIDSSKLYAIRSSSSQEDLPNASAAGMFKTFLNVKGIENLISSINKCFASVHSREAKKYLEQKNIDLSKISISVIVQEMIIPEYAGVLFTVNPLTGDDELVIETVEGLAESLVDGNVTPEQTVIKKNEKIKDPLKSELVKLGLKIENYFKNPQDIEWASCDDKVYVLQSRPVTTVTKELEDPAQVWTRANIGEIIPKPLTPLSWDIFGKVIFSSYRFGYYALHDRILTNIIHLIPREWSKIKSPKLFKGYAYLNMETVLISFAFEPWVTSHILRIGLGFDFAGTKIKRKQKITTKLIKLIKNIMFKIELLLPFFSFENTVFSFVKNQIGNKNNNLDSLLKEASFIFGWHIAATARSFSLLGYALNKSKNKIDETTFINSLSRENEDEFVARLANIQKIVENDLSLKEKIKSGNLNNYLDWNGFEKFKESFSHFLNQFGHRSENEFELRKKGWSEDPSLLKDVLLNYNDKKKYGSQDGIKETIQVKLLKAFRLRENLKDLLIKSYSNIRKYYIEKGKNLVREGFISQIEDIFFFHLEEIENILLKNPTEIQKCINNRKREYNDNWNICVPHTFSGDKIPTHEDLVSGNSNKIITGLGCSKGIKQGKAIHLFSLKESNRLKKGDILITTSTDPGWTPLFLVAGGVITEIGGMLSHAATIAREYRIPMITAVADISTRIKDGAMLEMDGGSGFIKILE